MIRIRVVLQVVHSHDKHGGISRRSRDHHLLCTPSEVLAGLGIRKDRRMRLDQNKKNQNVMASRAVQSLGHTDMVHNQ